MAQLHAEIGIGKSARVTASCAEEVGSEKKSFYVHLTTAVL